MTDTSAVRVRAALASAPLRGEGVPSSQVELAAALGVTPAGIGRYVQGARALRRRVTRPDRGPDMADRMAAVLRVPAGALLPGGPCPCCGGVNLAAAPPFSRGRQQAE